MEQALYDYLGFFEATKSTAPSQSGLIKTSVAEAQGILHKLGWPKTKGSSDGLYGPGTKGAWEKFAGQIKANPAFDRAGPREAWVDALTKGRLMVAAMPDAPPAEDPLLKKISEAAPYQAPAAAARAPSFTVLPEEKPATPVRVVNRPVMETQEILKALGHTRLALDGKYGPNTRRAWEGSANKRSLDPLFKRVSGTKVTVNMATWMKLKNQAGMAAKRYVPPSAPKPPPAAPAPAPGIVVKSVAELQKLLLAIGFKRTQALTDGLYGPTTAKAWAKAAANRSLPGTFDRVDGKTARVAAATYAKIAADVQARKVKAPAPAPAPKPAPGTVVKDVAELQALLLGIGVPKTQDLTDGLFGPKTRNAWRGAAGARKLPKIFERVSGKTARVASSTYGKIRADALARQKAPAPTPKPAPAPGPAPGTVVKSVAELQKLLLAIGFKKTQALTDGLYGPTTAKAWAKAAANRKLPGTFARVDGKTARVVLETYMRVKADAAKRREKAPTPKKEPVSSTVKISVKTLQQGLNGRGTRPLLDTDGIWGRRTERAFKKWLEKQPGGKESRYQVASNRREITLPRAYALSLQEAAKVAPLVPPRVNIAVSMVKKGLKAAGQPVGAGTKLDETTKQSLKTFIVQIDGGNSGYRVSKEGTRVLRIRKNIADKLTELARDVVPEPPKPTETISLWKTAQGPYGPVATHGLFLGLKGGCKGAPPSRSAWHLTGDAPGGRVLCMYVDGVLPKGLSAIEGKGLGTPIDVYGTMIKGASGLPFIKATRVEVRKGVKPKPLPTTPVITKPEPPPPAPDPIDQAAKQIASGAVSPIPVLTVQKGILATAYVDCANPPDVRYVVAPKCVSKTGVWDEKTGKAFLDVFQIEKRFHPYWFAAFPMLLSADRRTIRLFPKHVEQLNKLAEVYKSQQVQPPGPEVPDEPLPDPVPPPPPLPAPIPPPPPPLPPEEEEAYPQVPTPAPAPGQPRPQDMTAWSNLVGALRSIEAYGPKITAAIEEASVQGLKPEVAEKYQAWVVSVNDVLARAAQVIEQSPELQQAIDTVGTQMGIGLEGMNVLEAYFADVASTTSRILNVLREPFPSVLEGINLGQTASLAARAGAVAARFGSKLWQGLMQLLGSRTVAMVGATQVGVAGLGNVINGEVQSYHDYNRWILSKVASGELSPEAGEAAMLKPPKEGSGLMPLVVGGVILGGLALFLTQRGD